MNLRRLILVASLLLLSGVLPAVAQKIVLSGYVREAGSGEPLNGAVVFTADMKTGVSANSAGFYSIEVAAKEQVIKCSYAGYTTAEFTISPKGKNLKHDFLLEEDQKFGGVYPARTYKGRKYNYNGFSDHLPLVIRFEY